jgi:hypothetical protein
MKTCASDGDCRAGYVCRDPRQPPWDAILLDDNQSELVCIVPPDPQAAAATPAGSAAVCQPSGPSVPPIDAGTNLVDSGGAGDAQGDAPEDSPADGPSEADAGDGSGADAGDSSALDASEEG